MSEKIIVGEVGRRVRVWKAAGTREQHFKRGLGFSITTVPVVTGHRGGFLRRSGAIDVRFLHKKTSQGPALH
jgi:hypothetical protein